MPTLKIHLRNAFASGLAKLPEASLLPVRDFFLRLSPSARSSFPFKFLRVLRYRPVSPSIESFELPESAGIFMKNCNSTIVRRVFWLGKSGYEGFEIDLWETLCARATAILEIGANIGYYTVHGAKAFHGNRYLAVEPHPKSSTVLSENLKLNSLSRVEVLKAAIVRKKTEDFMELRIPSLDQDEAPSGAFLARGGEGIDVASSESVRVPLIEAEALAAETSFDLIKIDAEGYEYEILNGLEKLVIQKEPTILLEVLKDASSLKGLIDKWRVDLGYRAYAIGATSLHPIGKDLKKIILEERFGTRDILLTKDADLELTLAGRISR